jgi:hypothetical protein
MRRIIGAVAVAAAALAAAAVMTPAFAATRPAEHAAKTRTAGHGKVKHHVKPTPADVITSQLGHGGKYVTVVRCTGSVPTPPPVTLAQLNDPLTVRGGHPTAGVIKQLARPKTYRTVYSCTVTVKEKVPTPKKKTHPAGCELGKGAPTSRKSCHRVVLNTGFGGEAGTVAHHHPAG